MRVALRVGGCVAQQAVVVDVDPTTPTSELLSALTELVAPDARPFGAWVLVRIGAVLDPDAPVGNIGLRHGDLLLASIEPPSRAAGEDVRYRIVVLSGASAGALLSLVEGEHLVGSDPSAHLHLDDDGVAATHCVLIVDADGVSVRDLGSGASTEVDGQRVIGPPALVSPGSTLALGDVVLEVHAALPMVEDEFARDGRLLFVRPDRARTRFTPPRVTLPTKVKLPAADSRPIGRLARLGRHREPEVVEAVAPEAVLPLEAAREQVVAHRRHATPGTLELLERADRATSGLWERRPHDDDFLVLRLGIADLPTMVQLVDPPKASKVPPELRQQYAVDPGVPVPLDLRDGSLAVVGPEAAGEGLVRALVVQAATLHSPRDLAIVAIVSAAAAPRWSFLRWLPHTAVLGHEPVADRTVATDPQRAEQLSAELLALVLSREAGPPASSPGFLPHVLVVVIGEDAASAALDDVLARGAPVGVTAVVLADVDSGPPSGFREIATFGGFPGEVRLQRGDRGKVLDPVIAEQLTVPAADRAALNLAVRHHVHEGDVADLAPSATFAEVLGVDVLTPLAIGMRWDAAPPSPTFTLGTGVLAGIEVALDDTHPHLVVLGADADRRFDVITGWLVSLAVTHPPEDLAIVLVADGDRLAAGPAAELPHIVGVATTDATGVGARAMAALALGLDSRALGQASSVPTVVVVDVDALTVDPELTENLVELVRRGPTVGVHLLVSGVGPTELVAELRDAHASSVVLEAAPSTIARLGLGTSTVAVRLPGSSSTSDVHAPEVRPFPAPPTADGRSDVGTDLDGAASDTLRLSTRAQLRPIVDTVVDASRGRSAEPASRLRLEPLGNRYQLSDVAELLELTGEAGAPDEKGVAVGVLDDLITGRHAPWVLDAVDAGVVLIEGGPGSGRTTLLQTLAAALAQSRSSGELWLLGLDGGGGGLGALRTLPHCVGVVDADEIAELERLAGTLGRYIEHRRHATSEPDPETQPQVVMLIDQLGVVLERLEGSDERLAQDLTRALVAAAKDDGIGLVITSDDGTLPVELADRVGHRVVLTGGDDSDVPPGRAVDEGRPVQVALPGEAAPDAMEVFAALADRLSGDAVWAVPLLRPMPTEVERRELPSPTPGATDVPLGVDAWTLEPAWCRLHRTPTFAVIGPVGSGRSTALSTIVQGLAEAREGMEAYLLAPRPSRLVGLSCWWERGIGLEDSIELAALLADEAKEREPGAYPPMLVVVDDAGELASGAGADALAALLDRSRAGVTMVLAAASPSALAAGGPSWLRELWDRHHGLLLVTGDEAPPLIAASHLLQHQLESPVGRGYLISDEPDKLIQVAR